MKTTNVSKKIFAALVACIFTASIIHAQPPAPNGLPAPPPPANGAPAAPPPGKMQPPPQQQLQQVTTYKGTVVKMNTNDDYMYDGFYMLNNNDSLLVKFPPHLGSQITGVVKTGSTVSVNGVINVAPMGEKEIRFVSITANGKTIMDTSTARMATPPVETYISGDGKITQLQTNREGMVSGLIIDGKTILLIPPHVANQLSSVAQMNASVAYTGMKKAANNGEVSTADYAVVHCKTITINGNEYLVQ